MNQAAKAHYMSGSKIKVPIVFRTTQQRDGLPPIGGRGRGKLDLGEERAYPVTSPTTLSTVAGAVGETREEVLRLIRAAIEFHSDGLKQDGLPVPPPSSEGEFVEVAAA